MAVLEAVVVADLLATDVSEEPELPELPEPEGEVEPELEEEVS